MNMRQTMQYFDDNGRMRCPRCGKFMKSLDDARPMKRVYLPCGGSVQGYGGCRRCSKPNNEPGIASP